MKNNDLNSEKLYIVMPAYNEQDTIESVVREWYKILDLSGPDSKLIVADSGSTDMTHQLLIEIQKTLPKIVILHNTLKYHGPKLIAMYKYAIENGADWIFQTDSDGQTNPNEFIKFWNDRKQYDAVIGNRKVRGDGVLRKIVENIVCLLLRIYFGVRLQDSNAPFRLMKTDLVSKYIYTLDASFNLPNIILTTFFVYYKDNVTFKDITFENRKAGKNSINIIKIFKIGCRAMFDFKKISKECKNSEVIRN